MSEQLDLDRLALVLVDVQRGFDDAAHWGRRNNPACENNIATLLAAWREHHRPVVFVATTPPSPAHRCAPASPGTTCSLPLPGLRTCSSPRP